jgi:hypothetical protein
VTPKIRFFASVISKETKMLNGLTAKRVIDEKFVQMGGFEKKCQTKPKQLLLHL